MPTKSTDKKTTSTKKSTPANKTSKTASTFTKSAPKQEKTVNKASVVTEVPVSETPVAPRSVKVHKLTVIIALLIILAGVLLYYGRGYLVAAVVNGQPISRLELATEAEKTSGKQVMSSLIRTILVEQEAKKQKITISDKDVNDQIKDIEKNLSSQGQKIDQMLALQGMTRDDLKRIVRLDLLVTKIVGKNIKISDKDVDAFIKENKAMLPKDKKDAELKKIARDQLTKSQLPQKAQGWFDDLEKKANIVKFVNY